MDDDAQSAGPRRRRRGSTTRGEVVEAALAVADRVGVEGLTIRAVAKQANVPTMSLYTHFSSKAELLDLMYSEFVLRLYGDEAPATWQAGLLAVSNRVRALLVAHPHWVQLLSRPVQPMVVPTREMLLQLMTRDGMTPWQALAALASTVLIAEGLIMLEFSLSGEEGRSRLGERFERMKEWAATPPAAAHPTTRSAFVGSRQFDFADNFTFAMENYVKGLEAAKRVAEHLT